MFEGIVVTLGCVFFACAVFIFVMRAIRRQGRKAEISRLSVFDLAELQALRDGKKITSDEFERLRLIVLSQHSTNLPIGPRGFEVLQQKNPPA